MGPLDQYIQSLSSSDEKDIVWQYLLSASCNVPKHLISNEPHSERFKHIAIEVSELARQYGCSIGAIRDTLMIRLEMDDKFDENDDIADSQRKTREWSLHESTSEPVESVESISDDLGLGIGDRKTASFGPSMEAFENRSTAPAPESSRQIDSDHAPISKKMPKAIIANSIPDATIEPQAFIDNLTTEGRRMLEIILDMKDIRNAMELSKLEKTYGKQGFVLLASLVIDRRNIKQDDTGKLKKIVEGTSPQRIPH